MKWIPSSFYTQLIAESQISNSPRQVYGAHYSIQKNSALTPSSWSHHHSEYSKTLGITNLGSQQQLLIKTLQTGLLPSSLKGFNMNYGGHQFGQWAGQLGDGRALNIGEINGHQLQLKGSGRTAYSRHADGYAVLGSSVREYLMAEAMHYLGIASTRSLHIQQLEMQVERDVLYNGNPKWENTALVCRVAPSFIRFGNFEIFAARKEYDLLKQLADYTIAEYFPEIQIKSKEKYLLFFEKVSSLTLDMIIHWQRVGFVHGVMNTDNMSILGLSLDYGPFGFLDEYNPSFTPNLTDFSGKRYRFENQPYISQWNLLQLAQALYPLVLENQPFEYLLNQYPKQYQNKYTQMMAAKLGIQSNDERVSQLISELELNLQLHPTDFTIFFRELINARTIAVFIEGLEKALYQNLNKKTLQQWKNWYAAYKEIIKVESLDDNERIQLMTYSNPKYILRNAMLYKAIEELEKGEDTLFLELFSLLLKPYDAQPKMEKYYQKKPKWAYDTIGCSVLSCSS